MSIQEVLLWLEACRKECTNAFGITTKDLEELQRMAQEDEDKEAFSNICTIIQYSAGASAQFLEKTTLCHQKKESG
jgi:hypothetical protein